MYEKGLPGPPLCLSRLVFLKISGSVNFNRPDRLQHLIFPSFIAGI